MESGKTFFISAAAVPFLSKDQRSILVLSLVWQQRQSGHDLLCPSFFRKKEWEDFFVTLCRNQERQKIETFLLQMFQVNHSRQA